MGLRIAFELTDRDLLFFRKALSTSRAAVRHAEESEIVEVVRDVLDEIRQSEPLPDFVGKRIPELESLLRMLTDVEWKLPAADRERLLATFVYFADPEDILPDEIPVIGYLDDVIMIELVTRELQHVREASTTFARFAMNTIARLRATSTRSFAAIDSTAAASCCTSVCAAVPPS